MTGLKRTTYTAEETPVDLKVALLYSDLRKNGYTDEEAFKRACHSFKGLCGSEYNKSQIRELAKAVFSLVEF